MVNDFNSGMDFVTSSLKSESHKRTYEGRDGVKRVATEIMAREVGMPPTSGAHQTADSDFEEVGAE